MKRAAPLWTETGLTDCAMRQEDLVKAAPSRGKGLPHPQRHCAAAQAPPDQRVGDRSLGPHEAAHDRERQEHGDEDDAGELQRLPLQLNLGVPHHHQQLLVLRVGVALHHHHLPVAQRTRRTRLRRWMGPRPLLRDTHGGKGRGEGGGGETGSVHLHIRFTNVIRP